MLSSSVDLIGLGDRLGSRVRLIVRSRRSCAVHLPEQGVAAYVGAMSDIFPPDSPPPGWYESAGELRWWDGAQWTGHRAPLTYGSSPVVPAAGYGTGYPATFAAGQVVYTDARINGAEIAIAWIATVLTLGYMLPWAIAATRGKSNSLAVALVNFLLGWTFIGWVVALVMACTSHRVVAR
jgi:hypothetical protein